MRLALYQPDIPQNTGTLLRLAACMGIGVDIIDPCGFIWDDRRLRRAGLDYIASTLVTRHDGWTRFQDAVEGRLILLTTSGDTGYTDFAFRPTDTLLLGRESAGVPNEVHAAAAARLVIPMARDQRSLNVAVAGAMVLGEALRQTGGFPSTEGQH
ncbi:tRNA (cytidine(34)-2'-O)-methyltransferase [Fodinicurvata halophila]|uniref:tRNA (cytidine(34)-2'-O)-methyltransferase n=1 Tax=Fodinicurvata halophila TaxID=1419723 RepID=A0ABV8UPN1_9PROT